MRSLPQDPGHSGRRHGPRAIEEECPADLEAMTVFRPVHPGHETNWVGSFSSEEEERWLRVEARMPLDSPHETQNSMSRLRFHISGDGHETSSELPREPSPSDAPGATPEADPPHGSHRPASPCSRWWEPVCSLSWWGELFSAARRR